MLYSTGMIVNKFKLWGVKDTSYVYAAYYKQKYIFFLAQKQVVI